MKSGNKHGMNWISPHKRLAIYMRDGLACTWCGRAVEAGAQLTLDHLKPRKRGGGNHERNLITACIGCNAKRGLLSWTRFVQTICEPGSLSEQLLKKKVRKQLRRVVQTKFAKFLIDSRGGFTPAMATMATIKSCSVLRGQRSTLVRLLDDAVQTSNEGTICDSIT